MKQLDMFEPLYKLVCFRPGFFLIRIGHAWFTSRANYLSMIWSFMYIVIFMYVYLVVLIFVISVIFLDCTKMYFLYRKVLVQVKNTLRIIMNKIRTVKRRNFVFALGS